MSLNVFHDSEEAPGGSAAIVLDSRCRGQPTVRDQCKLPDGGIKSHLITEISLIHRCAAL